MFLQKMMRIMNLKRIAALVCAGALMLSCTACGSASGSDASSGVSSSVTVDYSKGLSENGFFDGIRALDYVTLPEDFQSIPLLQEDVACSDEVVAGYLSNLAQNYGTQTEVTDREAQAGDAVTIDFVGTMDGEEFEGGSAENYSIVLGSGSFIDGFEDQIAGHSAGDQFEVYVTFPDGYAGENSEGEPFDYSGKEAVFRVTLNSISEFVLTDEQVAELFEGVSLSDGTEITTKDMAGQYAREQQELMNRQNAVAEYLLENSTFESVPAQILDAQREVELQYAAYVGAMYGLGTADDVAALYGYDSIEAYLDDNASALEESARYFLALQAAAETIGFTPTAETLTDYFGESAEDAVENYGSGYAMQLAMNYAVLKTLSESAVYA